jgi:hypothetical protein
MTTTLRSDILAAWQYGTGWLDEWAITKADRDRAAKSGAAMPDGSYPITACSGGEGTVDAAVHAVGRGGADHDAIRRHVMKRAKALGCPGKIPDNWNSDGSMNSGAVVDALALPPMPGGKMPMPPGDGEKSEGDEADATVGDAIAKVEVAVAAAQKAQAADPDADDENDKAVAALLDQAAKIVAQAKVAQAKDAAGEHPDTGAPEHGTPEGPPRPPPGPHSLALPPTDTSEPNAQAVDDNGNIDAKVTCADPDCAHMAVDHENTATGANSGPCTVPGCSCQAMKVEERTTQNDEGGGPNNAGGEEFAATEPGDTVALNAPPDLPTGAVGEGFTIPVGVIEGQPVGGGDPRSIAVGALTWRQPPMPLMGLDTATHDPNGLDLNSPSVLCGVIERLETRPGDGDTQVVWATGHFLDTEDGQHFAALASQMGRIGISADIAVTNSTQRVEDFDDDGWPLALADTVTEGTILGFTIVPFPAFEGCYLVLGDGTVEPEVIPLASEPEAVKAAAPRLVVVTDLDGPCDCYGEGITFLRASAAPDRPPAAWFADPEFARGDGRVSMFKDGKHGACPITVTDDGRVFGHIAPWGVCHSGINGECVLAPRSRRGYVDFLRGQHVVTAEGERVPVGHLTAGIGHAADGLGASATMAHYDDTRLIAAMGSVGEDEFGIWFAGALAPWATESQAQMLRATTPSGDWRKIGGGLELTGALMVPHPGFPVAVVASGEVRALLAAGALQMESLRAGPAEAVSGRDVALRAALDPVLRAAGADARARIEASRARDRLRAAGVR